jgi:hypothetical protein
VLSGLVRSLGRAGGHWASGQVIGLSDDHRDDVTRQGTDRAAGDRAGLANFTAPPARMPSAPAASSRGPALANY